ncbi:pyruvate dehydrogenase complex dihydrolipoamide acetyltransferase [Pelagibius marinus]|uniref:pyruvate dehydrogenase complex dihydrolipoamide acetyltransferase n=1 Tax=Pelagibius marinus TaxID=2762760 RepID=UPI001873216A|nr:pyruvate dehydrogenase complex dihydrolipoamide acetyltransferase [Pelagibius marinus]
MPINILMPALSPTMTEGTLAKWLVKEGDEVTSGDVIAEIETDKATMEVEAVDEGTVGKIMVAEGTDGVPVNKVIAVLLEEGEDASAISEAPEAPAPKAAETEAAKPASSGNGTTPPTVNPQVTDAVTQAPAAPSGPEGRIFASPLARRIAKDKGVDLAAVKGSGPHGRIVKADVEAAQPGAAPAAAPAAAAAAPAAAGPQATGPGAKAPGGLLGMTYTQEPLSGMRKTIAKRLTESKQQVPHFYLTVDCELDELLKVRKELNSRSDAYKISVNDFVIRAVALALKQVPAANASYDESGLLFYEHADVSVAVATPSGLITPIIKAAEGKGLATIANEMKDLAGRARDGKLKPEEYQGGTFSVSNLGMFGIKEFSAVINPPQGCILAVGAGEQRPVVKDGALSVATVMSCTLSVDHRVVDGAVGAQFLSAFKKLIEDPLSMLL